MKLICERCGTKYSISDEKVIGKTFKLKCKKCQALMVINAALGANPSPLKKPQLRLALLGAPGAGKTTLALALSALCAQRQRGSQTSAQLLQLYQERTSDKRYNLASYASIATESTTQRYLLFDFKTRHDSTAALIGHAPEPINGAIWVVRGAPRGCQQLQLARRVYAPETLPLVLCLNTEGEPPEALEKIEIDLREQLSSLGVDADALKVVRINILQSLQAPEALSQLEQLFEALDETMSVQAPTEDVFFPIEAIVSQTETEITVDGSLHQGSISVGMKLALVGFGAQQVVEVTNDHPAVPLPALSLSFQRPEPPSLPAPIFPRKGRLSVTKTTREFSVGQVLATPGSLFAREKFQAMMCLLCPEDKGTMREGFQQYWAPRVPARVSFLFYAPRSMPPDPEPVMFRSTGVGRASQPTKIVAGEFLFPGSFEEAFSSEGFASEVSLYASIALRVGLCFSVLFEEPSFDQEKFWMVGCVTSLG